MPDIIFDFESINKQLQGDDWYEPKLDPPVLYEPCVAQDKQQCQPPNQVYRPGTIGDPVPKGGFSKLLDLDR